jgi:uncharacterized protein
MKTADMARLLRWIEGDAGLASLLAEVRGRLQNDPGHDLAHCLRVAGWTISLGGDLVDRRCAIAAALLHDVVDLPKDSADRSDASRRSAAEARILLAARGFSDEQMDAIAEAILTHSFSLGRVPTSPLGDALQDADRLEALGALGILRAATCGAHMKASYVHLDDPWAASRDLDDRRFTIDHFFKKLLRLETTLRTEAGRAEASRRTKHMHDFLRQLGTEIGRPYEAR